LEYAAKEVRSYLASLAQGRQDTSRQAQLDPDTYVEDPSMGGSRAPSPKAEPEPSREEEMAQYIRERAKLRDKRRL
jgi:hypothetical protein